MVEEDPKLSFDKQIEWLQKNHITIKDEEKCKDYLKRKTYFYKLIGFVKAFNNDKHQEIKTFGELEDLATLDMELRYHLLYFCLDVEHWIKTYILRVTTNNPNEDGYHIVREVINNDDNPEDFKRKLFSAVGYYENGIFIVSKEYKKFYDEPPIWTILEIASFGKLRSFIKYLSEQHPHNETLKQLKNSVKYINKLRNSCAHNREIINKGIYSHEKAYIQNHKKDKNFPPHDLYSELRRSNLTRYQILKPTILQIAVTLDLHKRHCSEGENKHRLNELNLWLKRADVNKKYYEDTIFGEFFNDIREILSFYVK